jgi:hypothetical protein
MHISIDVSGRQYDLPLNGDVVLVETFSSASLSVRVVSGVVRLPVREVRDVRTDRIRTLIPITPEWTTVAGLLAAAPDIPRTSLARILADLQARGEIRSVRPRSIRRGQNPRRWTRTED